MSGLVAVILFSLAASVLSLAGGVLLLLRAAAVRRWIDALAALAAGTLLSVTFFDLLPDALEKDSAAIVLPWTLGGFVIFFLLERAVLLFHARHGCERAEHMTASTPLVIIGDTLHNFIDGVVIGGTFVAGAPIGIATSLAIAAHEVPQEIGDFSILLHNGMARGRVLVVNVLSAMVTVVGAVLTWSAGERLIGLMPHFLALTSGFFLYIAAVDLIPELHHETRKTRALINTIALLVGVVVTPLVMMVVER